MPLYWSISFLMMIFVMMVMVDFYEKINNMNIKMNYIYLHKSMMNSNWEW